MCTITELFFHVLALIVSAKYFIKSKDSYLVEMEANQHQSQRLVDQIPYRMNSQVPRINFRIENPANVDLFIFKYCLFFFTKVLVAYYRFQKIFLQPRDKENPFDLEVFRFSKDQSSATNKIHNSQTSRSVKAYLELISSDPNCPICNEDYEENAKLVNFKCNHNHFFHLACINEWISRNPSCPICRGGLFN